ncbi:acyl-CoA dehydrogenase [Saccharomonospora viridis DSM 43017]|uniref:Acyl-CoA dehydrogenase n=2 Tax=Saccharomonospora viridis TaxID=1852 RepID=C7MU81_SACVD|nr:acyl-CoA dehydrogenase [Saccharomonospora viridis DSM 43017]
MTVIGTRPHDQAMIESVAARLAEASAEPDQAFHPATVAALDERDEFPTTACRMLTEWGLSRWYVPKEHGGELVDYLTLVRLVRLVARKDLTSAVAHAKTFLGAVAVWLGGDAEQAKDLAARINDGAVVSWALTERRHGSDLQASEVTASAVDGGWRITGEKWLINNATRADAVCLLARTEPVPERPSGGLSFFLLDKSALAGGAYRHLPKERTLGIRGADISGIAVDTVVPPEALVGDVGDGLPLVVRCLQLTRTMCAGLSLGAADHALRLAMTYASERVVSGSRLIELATVRRTLGEVAASALLAEAASITAARGVATLTGEQGVAAPVVKALVPNLVQEGIERIGELLGARGFLTDVYADGSFAKLDRDHRIVGIFDGTTSVCRHSLIAQFPWLVRGWNGRRCDLEGVRAASALHTVPRRPDLSRLSVVARTGCSQVQSLPTLVEHVERMARSGAVPDAVARLADAVRSAADRLHQELAAQRPSAAGAPATAFELAERYELCYAAASCLSLLCFAESPTPAAHVLRVRAALAIAVMRLREFDEETTDPSASAADALEDLVTEWQHTATVPSWFDADRDGDR